MGHPVYARLKRCVQNMFKNDIPKMGISIIIIDYPSYSTKTQDLSRDLLLPWVCWLTVPNCHHAPMTALSGLTSIWSHGKPKQYNGGVSQMPHGTILIVLGFANQLLVLLETHLLTHRQCWTSTLMQKVFSNGNPPAYCHWILHITGMGSLSVANTCS